MRTKSRVAFSLRFLILLGSVILVSSVEVAAADTQEYFNPQTGESRLVESGKNPPDGWRKTQPPANPQDVKGSLRGPEHELRRAVNPATGETQWLRLSKQPPAGWILLRPADRVSSNDATANAAKTTKQAATDYGAGGYREQDADQTGAVLRGRVFDDHGKVRQREKYDYALEGGKSYLSEKRTSYYDLDYRLTLKLDCRYNVGGGLKQTDVTHYGLHQERTSEEITDYRADGYEIRDWSIGKGWVKDFHTYKLQTQSGSTAAVANGTTSGNLGVLFPRDYRIGTRIGGSLWQANYAENFKAIPGLSEYSFPAQVYHLPDGSIDCARYEIGVKGEGYFPISARGIFSVRIPSNWKGPLDLQIRAIDAWMNAMAVNVVLHMGDPVAAPGLPENAVSNDLTEALQYYAANHLIDLWREAYRLENDIDDAYDAKEPDWNTFYEMEGYLYDLYDRIDSVASMLPHGMAKNLARALESESRTIARQMESAPDKTVFDHASISDVRDWADFLEDEGDYFSPLEAGFNLQKLDPYWTNPVLVQGKLGALRGDFGDDPFSYHLGIDKLPIYPLATTRSVFYFMPPAGLSAGPHDFVVDGPFFPETRLPVFHMALTMWADQLNLHKGQSTSYHAKLEGLNGLPANAWTSPFYPTDLVDPSEWAGVGAGPSGPMRTGYLTFSITNQSAGVITMQNVFRTLDAKMFAPSGSLQVDGGVGAVRDGTFSILGLVRAYLQPMFAIGGSAPAANTSVATDTWLPPINWDSTRESPISTNCSASYTYRPDCMNAMEREAYNGVTGNHMSVPVDHVSDLDAAKKRYDEAKKKYEFYRGFGAAWGMWGRVYSAFQHGLKNLSKEDQDDYNKAADRLMHSSENKRHYDAEYQKNSSEYNQKMLEAFANDENEDREALERMKQYLIDQFNEKDKAEWQQAKDAADKWNAEREASESELHEAENELNKAYRAANTK